jgi:hypothetical protein
MLNHEEVFELSLYFSPVDAPPLVHEIISDLRKPKTARLLPEDVVKALARKMSTATGVRPADFRKLTAANLSGQDVPMFGQVPVDVTAPNVSESDRMLIYDSVPEQRIWQRWASGDFDAEDVETATAWRDTLQRIDLRAIGASWKQFAQEKLASARNLQELIGEVTALLGQSKPEVQLELLGIALSLLRAPEEMRNFVFQRMLDRPGADVEALAPYAASILKLYLTFVGGLARGFIGPRPSHYADLQYLFYAPFCMLFVSSDKFHRDLWPAASGINSFAWGPDLKTELANRIATRKQMSLEEREAAAKENGFYPIELPGSIITDAWRKYMRPKEEIIRPLGRAKTIDDLEPEIRDLMRRAQSKLAERDDGHNDSPVT